MCRWVEPILLARGDVDSKRQQQREREREKGEGMHLSYFILFWKCTFVNVIQRKESMCVCVCEREKKRERVHYVFVKGSNVFRNAMNTHTPVTQWLTRLTHNQEGPS